MVAGAVLSVAGAPVVAASAHRRPKTVPTFPIPMTAIRMTWHLDGRLDRVKCKVRARTAGPLLAGLERKA